MKECNSVKQSPIAGLAAYGGGAGGLIFRKGVDGYQIDRSLRFNSADSAYLNRTPSSAGNRNTWTLSWWMKRSKLSNNFQTIFGVCDASATYYTQLRFGNTDKLSYQEKGSANGVVFETDMVFRDTSAWYHCVFVFNNTASSNSEKARLYVNGAEITSFSTDNRSQIGTTPTAWNNNVQHNISHMRPYSGSFDFDGYLADIHFIDGQALTASDFGEYDTYDVWQPKAYNGSFGTNGFHLKFADNSTIAALGTDSSGNNNTWTVNNLVATGGVALPGARTAVFFDGTDDKITYTSNSNLYPGATFTLEAWVYRLDSQEIPVFYGTSVGHVGFRVLSNGGMGVERINTAFDLNYNGSGTSVQNDEWTHVAWTKTGGTLRAFINGSNVATATNNSFSYQGDFVTARTLNDNRKFAISDLHLVVGTALYTNNFTPPSTISAHANTKLLCFQNASSATTATVAPSGVSLTATSSPVPGAYPSSENYQIDSLLDSPTNYEADSGNNGGNYATLNPLAPADGTISDGSLQIVTNSSGYGVYTSNFGMSSGKWYAEAVATAMPEYTHFGLIKSTVNYSSSTIVGNAADTAAYRSNDGIFRLGNSNKFTGATFAANDVIGLAFDADAGSCAVYKNGSLQGTATGFSSGTWFFAGSDNGNGTATHVWNFGQRPFAYTPPTGHVSLCTQNFADPTIEDGSDYFDTKLYTGNGSSVTVSGLAFSPDFVWLKGRSDPDRHGLFDTVRGATKRLQSSESNAEDTQNGVTAFNSDGIAIGNYAEVNGNGRTYVAWSWNAGADSDKTYAVKVVSDSGNKYRFDDFGTSAVTLNLAEGSTYIFDQSDSSNSGHPLRFSTTANGTHGGGSEYTTGVTVTGTPGQAGAKTTIVVAASAPTLFYYCTQHSGMGGQANTNSTAGASNFDGGIQSTVKASPLSGFSIVTYTGNGNTSTVGHSLNATPKLLIIKNRSASVDWVVYTTAIDGSLDFGFLNTSSAFSNSSVSAPTSSVFSVVDATTINTSGNNYIAYCISPVAGFSAVGTYEGTGSPVFVYTGFRPAFVLYKNADAAAGWQIYDSTRDSFNQCDARLQANQTGAEDTQAAIDILSNGFTQRATHTRSNTSGNTYVYAAFAEHPFKTARAR